MENETVELYRHLKKKKELKKGSETKEKQIKITKKQKKYNQLKTVNKEK